MLKRCVNNHFYLNDERRAFLLNTWQENGASAEPQARLTSVHKDMGDLPTLFYTSLVSLSPGVLVVFCLYYSFFKLKFLNSCILHAKVELTG